MRKVAGVLVIVFLGLPSLNAIIWVTGTSMLVARPARLSQIPEQVVQQLPAVMEQAFLVLKQPGVVRDPHAQIWLKAIGEVKPGPYTLLKQVGAETWFRQEFGKAAQDFGKFLRTEKRSGDIALDYQGLKQALTSEVFQGYLKKVVAHLPACTPRDMAVWKQTMEEKRREGPYPPCNPGEMYVRLGLARFVAEVSALPAREVLVPAAQLQEGQMALSFVQFAVQNLFFMFLFPAMWIFLGAGIGGTGGRGLFRWVGISTLLGGLFPLAVASFVQGFAIDAVRFQVWTHVADNHAMQGLSARSAQLLMDKILPLIESGVMPLFASVGEVAKVVCLVGIGCIVLSLFIPKPKPKQPQAKQA